jgi:hypothetical protein
MPAFQLIKIILLGSLEFGEYFSKFRFLVSIFLEILSACRSFQSTAIVCALASGINVESRPAKKENCELARTLASSTYRRLLQGPTEH